MKILIIGEKYSENLGDGIICEIIEKFLYEYYPGAYIKSVDISGRTGYSTGISISQKTNFSENLKIIIKKNIRLFLDRIGLGNYIMNPRQKIYIKEICSKPYDIAIFAGGHLLKDTFVLPIKNYIEFLSLNETPIILNACGASEIKNSTKESILKEALSNKNIKAISIRDNIELVNSVYLKDRKLKAEITYDPGIWAGTVYNSTKCSSNTIGLGVMLVPKIEVKVLLKFWIAIISTLNANNLKWKIFCNGSNSDYEFGKSILEYIGYSEDIIDALIVRRPKKPSDLVNDIGKFNGIISFRLHSHIIAYSLNIPSIAMVWDRKLEFFFDSIGFINRCKQLEDSSIEIIESLEQAQKENYNKELKSKQKNHSLNMLIKYIERSLNIN